MDDGGWRSSVYNAVYTLGTACTAERVQNCFLHQIGGVQLTATTPAVAGPQGRWTPPALHTDVRAIKFCSCRADTMTAHPRTRPGRLYRCVKKTITS
jgi:hypothetical protein